jgi:hypothetical protein
VSPEAKAGRVPDLVLERYRLGELPESEATALAGRLASEPELQQRLEALERSDAEARDRVARARLAEGVRARLAAIGAPAAHPAERREPAWRAMRFAHWPAALAVTAALVLAVSTLVPRSGPLPRADEDRVKGLRPALSLYRRTAGGSEALADGDRARAGDWIRVGYRAAGRRFGVIVSLDGRGGVTRHLPAQGETAVPLESRDVVLLENAYELDDAPRFERFFFVTAESRFEVAVVVEAARRAAGEGAAAGTAAPAQLRLPRPLEQSTFLLAKER